MTFQRPKSTNETLSQHQWRLWLYFCLPVLTAASYCSVVGLFYFFIAYHQVIKINVPDTCWERSSDDKCPMAFDLKSPVSFAWASQTAAIVPLCIVAFFVIYVQVYIEMKYSRSEIKDVKIACDQADNEMMK